MVVKKFIVNGIEFGFIWMFDVDCLDFVYDMLKLIDEVFVFFKGVNNV